MLRKLVDKVAIVTGASSGIGRACAQAFSREGAKTVVADIDEKGGLETVELISRAGGTATFVKTDVSIASQVEKLISTTVEKYGRVDCACNNAGIQGDTTTTADCTEANWDYVIDVCLKGVWLCMKYEIHQMLKQGGGAIVNMSSVNAFTAWPNLPPYVASKHGINGITKEAAIEFGSKGIRINAVAPGIILTPMNTKRNSTPEEMAYLVSREPIGRLGTPEEVAKAVVWLCTDDASFVLGHCLLVDGGFIIP